MKTSDLVVGQTYALSRRDIYDVANPDKVEVVSTAKHVKTRRGEIAEAQNYDRKGVGVLVKRIDRRNGLEDKLDVAPPRQLRMTWDEWLDYEKRRTESRERANAEAQRAEAQFQAERTEILQGLRDLGFNVDRRRIEPYDRRGEWRLNTAQMFELLSLIDGKEKS